MTRAVLIGPSVSDPEPGPVHPTTGDACDDPDEGTDTDERVEQSGLGEVAVGHREFDCAPDAHESDPKRERVVLACSGVEQPERGGTDSRYQSTQSDPEEGGVDQCILDISTCLRKPSGRPAHATYRR